MFEKMGTIEFAIKNKMETVFFLLTGRKICYRQKNGTSNQWSLA